MPVQRGFAPLVENPQLADFQVLQLVEAHGQCPSSGASPRWLKIRNLQISKCFNYIKTVIAGSLIGI